MKLYVQKGQKRRSHLEARQRRVEKRKRWFMRRCWKLLEEAAAAAGPPTPKGTSGVNFALPGSAVKLAPGLAGK